MVQPKALNPATYQRKNTNRPCAIDINTSIRLIHARFDEISTKRSFNAAKYSKDAADCSRPQGELGLYIHGGCWSVLKYVNLVKYRI